MTDWLRPPVSGPGMLVWEQLCANLREAVAGGKLSPGSRLPAEIDLAQLYGVSRTTLRRALSRLQDEGILQSVKGVGLYTRAAPRRYQIAADLRFSDALQDEAELETKTLSLSEGPLPDSLRQDWPEAANGSWLHLRRLRIVDGVPFYLVDKWFPGAILPGFAEHYALRGSVLDAYHAVGIPSYRPAGMRVGCRFASAAEAEALALTPGAPVLARKSVNFCPEGRIIEISCGLWPAMAVELDLSAALPERRMNLS